jgi:hypothetical protein
MPPFRATLSDTEMAQLSNYVIFQFGGKDGKATADRRGAAEKRRRWRAFAGTVGSALVRGAHSGL